LLVWVNGGIFVFFTAASRKLNTMKKRIDDDKDTLRRDESLEDQIYDALIEKGRLIPQIEEDINVRVRCTTAQTCG
jgi:hypothetical protein